MKHPLEDVSMWLQSHANQNIMIRKHELNDLDQARIMLEFVGYSDGNNCSVDDYAACKALLLHGAGVIITDSEEAPLPDGTFTIPVDNLSRTEVRNDRVTLENGRGVYTLSVQ
ncbi:hypothetical protein [Paenibacillus sp. DMB20]|uniref:hypothetical protein n=1 Tax=Paenibacillus sp. DMB20 TaxID=1642570 RepID=UPI000627F8BB|nr:hypothetical protein [Paenibacillus sp. DMB20]KKO53068.1 hypothetical protein XI25_15300 [Paenibacillus sp. DMB20]